MVSLGKAVVDHVKDPVVDGTVENAAGTAAVFIDLLKTRVIGEEVPIPTAPWAGETAVTTGSSGWIIDWAMNIFAEVPGTLTDGICCVAVTVSVSPGLRRFATIVPAG